MNIISLTFIGNLLGNCCMAYLFARAYAEKHGCQLQTGPWIGQKFFDISDPPISQTLPRRSEQDLQDGEVNIDLYTYAQNQQCMIYTREQARSWLRVKPHLAERLESALPTMLGENTILAHRRTGDYKDLGYVVVSCESYYKALTKFGFLVGYLKWVTAEDPVRVAGFDGELSCLPDFYRLMRAPVMFRGNSSFSWTAGLLGHGEVFSPVIEGLEGGKEQHCDFAEGNWPRFANLGFITDLHVL